MTGCQNDTIFFFFVLLLGHDIPAKAGLATGQSSNTQPFVLLPSTIVLDLAVHWSHLGSFQNSVSGSHLRPVPGHGAWLSRSRKLPSDSRGQPRLRTTALKFQQTCIQSSYIITKLEKLTAFEIGDRSPFIVKENSTTFLKM